MKRTVKYHLSRLWFPMMALILLVYFIYYFFYGEHGYFAMHRLNEDVTQAQQNLKIRKKEHDALAHRVSLLKSESLDKDLLEERIREMLDYAKKEDIIIFDQEDSDS